MPQCPNCNSDCPKGSTACPNCASLLPPVGEELAFLCFAEDAFAADRICQILEESAIPTVRQPRGAGDHLKLTLEATSAFGSYLYVPTSDLSQARSLVDRAGEGADGEDEALVGQAAEQYARRRRLWIWLILLLVLPGLLLVVFSFGKRWFF